MNTKSMNTTSLFGSHHPSRPKRNAPRLALLAAVLSCFSTQAVLQYNQDGTPRGDCSKSPGTTEVRLDWRGQNLVGCQIELVSTLSRIHRVASDCTTMLYTDLPAYVPRQWTILSQPTNANAQVTVTGNSATLTLPRAGDYTVQLTICPAGNCQVFDFPGSTSTFALNASRATITVRAETELPLRVQERPVLPPSALQSSWESRLNLTDEERDCRCQGGGGLVDPQWVTVSNWTGASDYKRVEGYVSRSWPSVVDAPFNHDLVWSYPPTGNFYVDNDINLQVSPDPRDYNLLSTKPEFESYPRVLGCETGLNSIPERLRPLEGDRVSLFGFWILDCGHEPYYTEIHPIVGWAVHRNRPVRLPDNATFSFNLGSNTVTSTAGNNLYVPGIVTDLWFNSDAGEITSGDNTSLAQPARCNPAGSVIDANHNITQSPIQREYDFNIYLPPNPADVFAAIGQVRPRAPLYVTISNPHASDGPPPTYTRMTETNNGVTYEYLKVHLDLRNYAFSTYSRRIEAAWVYPKADNWGLAQWRVTLSKLDVYDDLDGIKRGDGDWRLWFQLPGADQAWTRILDGFNNAHGTMTFTPPWHTGSSDSVFHRPPLSLDNFRRLGSDVLSFNNFLNFGIGGYEADDGEPSEYPDWADPIVSVLMLHNEFDPGRISSFVPGLTNHYSDNGKFSAEVSAEKIATLNNGVLSPAATALARSYLLNCTNRIPFNPVHGTMNPLATAGMAAEGISGEPPWSPVDPLQLYGSGAALIGDVDKDGSPDMALGTRGTNVEAHIFLGGQNGFAPAPHAIASVTWPGAVGYSPGTRTFTGAGDLNGDGFPDLLLNAPTYLNFGTTNGAVFAFSGAKLSAGGTLRNGEAFWSVIGSFPNAQFGTSVAVGDINRDGRNDVIVSAPFYQNSEVGNRPVGRVFVYLNSPGGLPAIPSQTLIPPTVIGSQHWFGYSAAMAGDLNRDGYIDVIVGAPRYTNPEVNEGAFFTYYGSSTGLVLNATLSQGQVANAQFGYAVAGAGDLDGDGYSDVLVSAPFYGSGEFTVGEGSVAAIRGSIGGIAGTLWSKQGGYAGAHFGTDLAGIGDINGDGLGDVAIGAPDETSLSGLTSGLRGRVSFFLGVKGLNSTPTETWRTWGVNGLARPPLGVSRASDINSDGFDDTLTFDSTGGGDPFARVKLVLGRGRRNVVLAEERFYSAGGAEEFAFPAIYTAGFETNMIRSGQTNEAKLAALLAQVKGRYLTSQQAGGSPASLVPTLLRLKLITPQNLFAQYFGDVDLELGNAFYVDCGAPIKYVDKLGRQWVPDEPFLVSSNTSLTTFDIGLINHTLLGDHYLPDAMLNTDRSRGGALRYQVGVPNGSYTVLLYFAENSPQAVSPALGGTGCGTCATIFDLEVEGQLINAYNQADAALPPNGDGFGRLYTATQVAFNVDVADGILDIAVLIRGGRTSDKASIKGFAILGRPSTATKLVSRPRIAGLTRDGRQFGVLVDPLSNLARYHAGEIPLRLQVSTNLTQWVTLPNLPEVQANGAYFPLPPPTNQASFYRALIPPP